MSSSQRTTKASGSKSEDLKTADSGNKEEENKLETVIVQNTVQVEIRFPEVQEIKCDVLDDQKTVKRIASDSAAEEIVTKKLKYDFKYESKLEYRNYK